MSRILETKNYRTRTVNKPVSSAIATEIAEWAKTNKDSDFVIKSHNNRQILLTLNYNGIHEIEITVPDKYPTNKKGFACVEKANASVIPIKFIPRANKQFKGKSLSVIVVLKHLAVAFAKLKLLKKSKDSTAVNQALQNQNMSGFVEDWHETANSNTDQMSDTSSDQMNAEASENAEDLKNFDQIANINKILAETNPTESTTSQYQFDDTYIQNLDNVINEALNASFVSTTSVAPVTFNQTDANDTLSSPFVSPDIEQMQTSSVDSPDIESHIQPELASPDTQSETNAQPESVSLESQSEPIVQSEPTSLDTQLETVQPEPASPDTQLEPIVQPELIVQSEPASLDTQLEPIVQPELIVQSEPASLDTQLETIVQPELIVQSEPASLDTQLELVSQKDSIIYPTDIIHNSQETNKTDITYSLEDLTDNDLGGSTVVSHLLSSSSDGSFEDEPDNSISNDSTDDSNDIPKCYKSSTRPIGLANTTDYSDDQETSNEDQYNNQSNISIGHESVSEDPDEEPDNNQSNISIGHESVSEDVDEPDNNQSNISIGHESVSEDPDEDIEEEEQEPVNDQLNAGIGHESDSGNSGMPQNATNDNSAPVNNQPNVNAIRGERQSVDANKQRTIEYTDVHDQWGMYQDLSKYPLMDDAAFEKKTLLEKAKLYRDMFSIGLTNTSKRFSDRAAINATYNDYVSLYNFAKQNCFSVTPIDKNIYNLLITLPHDFFDPNTRIYSEMVNVNCQIMLVIKIHPLMHPFYPPQINVKRPHFHHNFNIMLATIPELTVNKWNPTITLEKLVVEILKPIIETSGSIESDIEYDELEQLLVELSLITETPARHCKTTTIEPQSDSKTTTIEPQSDSNGKTDTTYWAKGTGYGYGNNKVGWDYKSYIKAVAEKERQIAICVRNITKRLTKIILNNIEIDAVQILMDSCFVPFMKGLYRDVIVMNMTDNISAFSAYLDVFRIMPLSYSSILLQSVDPSDPSDLSLLDIFKRLKADCDFYLKTVSNTTTKNKQIQVEINLIDNYSQYIDNTVERIKKCAKTQHVIDCIDLTTDVSIKEIYCCELTDEVCKEYPNMNMHAFSNLIASAGDTMNSALPPNSVSRISKEILAHHKNMPINYDSSIFYRFISSDLRFHEFLITGPADTPYDSGCFHFRLYCPTNYPNKVPKAQTCTVGNCEGRFNPNLYESGHICLSLLGTWIGHSSESWIPSLSTMMQIMVSLQSLVFVPEPYFNETGYQRKIGTSDGIKVSAKYNQRVRLMTLKYAILGQIQKPVPGFEDAIRKHFRIKADYIKNMCRKWICEACDTATKNKFKLISDKIDNALDTL